MATDAPAYQILLKAMMAASDLDLAAAASALAAAREYTSSGSAGPEIDLALQHAERGDPQGVWGSAYRAISLLSTYLPPAPECVPISPASRAVDDCSCGQAVRTIDMFCSACGTRLPEHRRGRWLA